MQKSRRQTNAQKNKITKPASKIGVVEKENSAAQITYFRNLSKLETKLNNLVNNAKDYPQVHKLMVSTIESDPAITFADKQELYDTYEEMLYKKLEHTFKRSPIQ